MSMEKKFDEWNILKKSIEDQPIKSELFLKPGEVWMIVLGLNIGHEQNGSGEHYSRPGLIIKKFNRNMFWILPLSTQQKDLDFYYNFTDPLGRDVAVILAQIKLCSVKRIKRKLYDIDKENFKIIISKLKDFL